MMNSYGFSWIWRTWMRLWKSKCQIKRKYLASQEELVLLCSLFKPLNVYVYPVPLHIHIPALRSCLKDIFVFILCWNLIFLSYMFVCVYLYSLLFVNFSIWSIQLFFQFFWLVLSWTFSVQTLATISTHIF